MTNYLVEYNSMLETAFNFLHRKAKKVNGSALNQSRAEFIIANKGCCLHCGKRLTNKNSNTEHIHDRALGGPNVSSNKIIMCKSCNLARNATMQQYLGAPSYWRGFPGNWDRVKKYLLWNAITADKGHRAGEDFPEVHSIFESIVEDNNLHINPPNRWYGRGNKGNLITTNRAGKRSFLIRFFDKVFGYEPTNIFNSTHTVSDAQKDIVEVKEEIIKPVKARKILDLDEDFYKTILSALDSVDGEVHLAAFSGYFQLFVVSKGLPKQSLKEFAISHGIPKRRTFVQIIEDYFPNEISYRREGETVVHIQRKRGVFEGHAIEEE